MVQTFQNKSESNSVYVGVGGGCMWGCGGVLSERERERGNKWIGIKTGK